MREKMLWGRMLWGRTTGTKIDNIVLLNCNNIRHLAKSLWEIVTLDSVGNHNSRIGIIQQKAL